MSIRAIFALSLLATPVAAQPYSTSMAQCAGLMGAMTTWAGEADDFDKFFEAARVWIIAARDQAQSEGVEDARFVVSEIYTESRDMWLSGENMADYSTNFKDWGNYCKRFAKDRGVNLPF